MSLRNLLLALGALAILGAAGFALTKRDRILFWFEPKGSRVVLAQYVLELGQQKSRAAGYFDSFDDCEKERERLPIGGGFVLGGVCVRESQWQELSH